jgi:hypothetical protein
MPVWGPPDVDLDAGVVERDAVGGASHNEIVPWIERRAKSLSPLSRAVAGTNATSSIHADW